MRSKFLINGLFLYIYAKDKEMSDDLADVAGIIETLLGL